MDSVHRRGIFPLHVGKSPLDVLAEKPTAFRSGIHLGWFNKIIYHCKILQTKPKYLQVSNRD